MVLQSNGISVVKQTDMVLKSSGYGCRPGCCECVTNNGKDQIASGSWLCVCLFLRVFVVIVVHVCVCLCMGVFAFVSANSCAYSSYLILSNSSQNFKNSMTN
jgi:hypothetical protein